MFTAALSPGADPAPRVDLVQIIASRLGKTRLLPARVEPGKTYRLSLRGVNFRPGTEITLGEGITIVSPPFVHSPTKATLDILVEPSATPGVNPSCAPGDRSPRRSKSP